MGLESHGMNGIALGAWGAVQATAPASPSPLGGALRDVVSHAERRRLGQALRTRRRAMPVYHLELPLLFATLIAIGPLVRRGRGRRVHPSSHRFGLAELPS